jgi:hypothetical protein
MGLPSFQLRRSPKKLNQHLLRCSLKPRGVSAEETEVRRKCEIIFAGSPPNFHPLGF